MSQPGRKENKHDYLVLTRSSTNILKRHQVYKYTQVPMFTLYYFKVITLYISFFDNIHSYITKHLCENEYSLVMYILFT